MAQLSVRAIPVPQTRRLRHAVLRPNEGLDVLASRESPDAFAIGAFDGDDLVSVGLIAPDGEPGSWRVRGMATAPEARGRGAGSAVLEALLAHASQHGARRVWCNVRTRARSLYERAGFSAISEEFELPDIGPHFVLERRWR
jgi:ribosomal protein S18 acetylase RimI-like enzyme